MKTVFLAIAAIAVGSFATAQESIISDNVETEEIALEITAEEFNVIDVDRENGLRTIVTEQNGEYTLTAVACLPLMSAVMDKKNIRGELNRNKSEISLEEVTRGTTRHEIASYACDHDD